MDTYSKEFVITYREVDSRNQMKLNTVVDFMQDMSRLHATKLGVSYATDDDPYYWIIMRTKVVLDEYPQLDDVIRMETHIEGLDRLFSVRRFNIFNSTNKQIGYIQGYYLLMDKTAHTPVRMKSVDKNLALHNYPYQGDKLEKLNPNITEVKRNFTRRVYSGEIDSNNHMNNAHYIRWALDMFTTSELLENPVREIQIQFVKEMLEGTEVSMELGLDSQGDTYVCGHNQKDGTLHYICKIAYSFE